MTPLQRSIQSKLMQEKIRRRELVDLFEQTAASFSARRSSALSGVLSRGLRMGLDHIAQ